MRNSVFRARSTYFHPFNVDWYNIVDDDFEKNRPRTNELTYVMGTLHQQ